MALSLAIFVILVAIVWWKYRRFSTMLDHIPGPKGHPLVGNALQMMDYTQFRNILSRWAQEYGPIYKLRLNNKYYIVLSDYKTLHEILLEKGKEFAGRYTTWRITYALKNTGIVFSPKPDNTWKMLRKVSHRHLKQFGEGMSRLQEIITKVAEEMYDVFQANLGKPVDPKDAIKDTALKTIALFIIGRRCRSGDPLLERMRLYEPLFMKYVISFAPIEYTLIDTFPWLRFFLPGPRRNIDAVPELETAIWSDAVKEIRDNPERDSLVKLLMSFTDDPEFGTAEEVYFTGTDAMRTCMSLIVAGFSTTSSTFHGSVNLLAHHKDVQDKMAAEIGHPREEGQVTLDDRPNLPYCRATIYEVLRYFTVAYQGGAHAPLQDVEIAGYKVPTGVTIVPNLWSLHRDKDVWGDPEAFRPERFLDDAGQLLPADHPTRKNLLPFGAGPRVCLGESLAIARIFLWAANLVQRFEVSPAPGNDIASIKGEYYYSETILYSKPYSVIFMPREFKV